MDFEDSKELRAWIDSTINDSVKRLSQAGILDSQIVQAKTAWVLPFSLLIGKARQASAQDRFLWFIHAGNAIWHANEEVAATPREAAKYFALKWQLEAQKIQNNDAIDDKVAAVLVEQAEALFELTGADQIWATSSA